MLHWIFRHASSSSLSCLKSSFKCQNNDATTCASKWSKREGKRERESARIVYLKKDKVKRKKKIPKCTFFNSVKEELHTRNNKCFNFSEKSSVFDHFLFFFFFENMLESYWNLFLFLFPSIRWCRYELKIGNYKKK